MKKTIIILLALVSITAFSQDKKEAMARYSVGNYEGALEELLELYEIESDSYEYAYMIGVCYINSNIDKSAAVPYFEHAVKDPKVNENSHYLLGRAFHFAYQFDDAIKSYRKFKETAKSNNPNLIDVDKQIEYCENAKELMKFPVNVSFENLGKHVNSAYSDYYPFIPSDESYLIFNSKRDEESDQLPSGEYLSNIYLSSVKEGDYSEAKLINFNINTKEENEEVVGLNAAGDKVIIYKENFQKGSALYESSISEQRVDVPSRFPKTINSKYTEIAASFSSTGSKIYFASDRPDGYGGIDIYMCQK
ncbi:MAG: PD40 domain-containing protein, partial [Flavobacteriales bacterium]|nr:PD40 domain-containing protein [Flavobacteriales bacterium]